MATAEAERGYKRKTRAIDRRKAIYADLYLGRFPAREGWFVYSSSSARRLSSSTSFYDDMKWLIRNGFVEKNEGSGKKVSEYRIVKSWREALPLLSSSNEAMGCKWNRAAQRLDFHRGDVPLPFRFTLAAQRSADGLYSQPADWKGFRLVTDLTEAPEAVLWGFGADGEPLAAVRPKNLLVFLVAALSGDEALMGAYRDGTFFELLDSRRKADGQMLFRSLLFQDDMEKSTALIRPKNVMKERFPTAFEWITEEKNKEFRLAKAESDTLIKDNAEPLVDIGYSVIPRRGYLLCPNRNHSVLIDMVRTSFNNRLGEVPVFRQGQLWHEV